MQVLGLACEDCLLLQRLLGGWGILTAALWRATDKDSGHKMITGDGVFDFCDDLGIDATTDVAILVPTHPMPSAAATCHPIPQLSDALSPPALLCQVLAYHMDAKTMGQFTRDEWMKGMTALGYGRVRCGAWWVVAWRAHTRTTCYTCQVRLHRRLQEGTPRAS